MQTPNSEQVKTTDEAAQEAADYDRWFRAKAQAALDGLTNGTNRPLSDDEEKARRAALRARFLPPSTKAGA